MYQGIKAKKRVAEIYADTLVAAGVVSREEDAAQKQGICDGLGNLHAQLKARIKAAQEAGTAEHSTGEYQLDRSPSPEVKTAVSAERLRVLNEELLQTPEGFAGPPKLARPLGRRRGALGADGGIDGAHAESLAFASLLTEGTPIRLTGQDVE